MKISSIKSITARSKIPPVILSCWVVWFCQLEILTHCPILRHLNTEPERSYNWTIPKTPRKHQFPGYGVTKAVKSYGDNIILYEPHENQGVHSTDWQFRMGEVSISKTPPVIAVSEDANLL